MKIALNFIGLLLICSVITYLFVFSGFDWHWAVFFNGNDFWVTCSVPFVILGIGVPILIPLVQFFLYKKKREDRFLILAKKSFWSFITAYIVMTVLKVFTNRVDMEPFEPIGNVDFSNQFRFGFMNSDHWWESLSEGWPSGHTMIAVAMAVSVHSLLRNKWAKTLNIVYPICIAISVSTAFHWVSDVVSGGVIGMFIGYQVKKGI